MVTPILLGFASSRYDPMIHDPTMHDSCINYANILTLYRDYSSQEGKI